MKFKVGDTIRGLGMLEEKKVIRMAKEGAIVRGPWWGGRTKQCIPEEAYIIEDEKGYWLYITIQQDFDYELVKPEKPLKFKVGDNIRIKAELNQYALTESVIRIAKEGETVEGPWQNGDSSYKMSVDSYILEGEETKLLSRLPVSAVDIYEKVEVPKTDIGKEELLRKLKDAFTLNKEAVRLLQESLELLKDL